jgi:hypothetical protein
VSAKRCICLALLLVAVTLAAQQARAQDDGKYAGAFLEIPVGSYALSMGGAFASIANDQSAFHWNPAGVSLVPHKLAGFMYSSEFGAPGSALATFYHLGFTMPLEHVTLSGNWVRLSIGDMLHTPDLTGISVTDERQRMVREIYGGTPDYFTDNEDAFVLSVARNNTFTMDWGWLYYKQQVEIPVGVNFKIIHEGVGNFGSASGIGVDVGAMLRFSLAEFLQMPVLGKLSLGATATDLFGTRLLWNTQRHQTIPMHFVAGGSYTQVLPFVNWTATLSADALPLEREKARLGMDISYRDDVSLRAGLNRGLFTTGAGFNWDNKAKIDYSLGLNDALGPEHRLSFSVDIDNVLRKDEDK